MGIMSRLPLRDRFRLELVSHRWARLVRQHLWPSFTARLDATTLSTAAIGALESTTDGWDGWGSTGDTDAKYASLFRRCSRWVNTLRIGDGASRFAILREFTAFLEQPGSFPSLKHLSLVGTTKEIPSLGLQLRTLEAVARQLPGLKTLAIDICPTPSDYFTRFSQLEALVFTGADSAGRGASDSIALPSSLKYLEVRVRYSRGIGEMVMVRDTAGATAVFDAWVEAVVRDCRQLETLRLVQGQKRHSMDALMGVSDKSVRLISQLGRFVGSYRF